MVDQFPVIIIVAPLVTSFLVFACGWRSDKIAFPLVATAMTICLLCAVVILNAVMDNGVISYAMGGWQPPWGIEYRIDHLNALMLVLVSGLGLLMTFHVHKSVVRELPDKTVQFWSLFLLLMTGLLGICITGDMFNLFVLLEVVSLSGYALIAMGDKRATYAAFRYVIIGTVGASFYLVGVGYLYISTGSLNMADLARLLPALYASKAVLVGFIFILIGLGIKLAIFPMHMWLPDAYTYAPSAVSTIAAPLVTKVMAYALIRLLFTVFGGTYTASRLAVTDVMVWIGTVAILFGAAMALSQRDIKRMLAYIIIAEIGYIVGGIGVANITAMKGAIFHIVNDALMMACLFAAVGLVAYQAGGHRISHFTGFFKSMPVTATVFTIGALAVIGVPPTCGFFSKWYLLLGGIQARQWAYVAALLICTLINIALFFRVLDKGLFFPVPQDEGGAQAAPGKNRHGEGPLSMLIPACAMAAAVLLTGLWNQAIIQNVIQFAVPLGQ